MERWSIRLHKDDFKFSCAHFLIFPDGSKERLHGHNYQLACEIGGGLDDRGLVLDFNRVKPVIRSLCRELNEQWLLPGEHPELVYRHRDDGHTEVVYRGCRYLAPTAEVRVLPINNVSVENLAAWCGAGLRARLQADFPEHPVDRIEVAIAELLGQQGVYRWEA